MGIILKHKYCYVCGKRVTRICKDHPDAIVGDIRKSYRKNNPKTYTEVAETYEQVYNTKPRKPTPISRVPKACRTCGGNDNYPSCRYSCNLFDD